MAFERSLREITGLHDAALPQLLDIYQQSFPLREQMPFSWWIDLLREKDSGAGEHRHLVALEQDGECIAFAYYEADEDGVYLWYLATRADQRGGGVGAQVFQEIKRQAFARGRYLFFEVELPEEAARFSAEEGELARRRIAWYQRQGARLLGGIEYIQDVGWQPAYPMALMIATPEEIAPQAAYEIAASLLEDAVRAVGPLTLD